jgi:hypothetical protein
MPIESLAIHSCILPKVCTYICIVLPCLHLFTAASLCVYLQLCLLVLVLWRCELVVIIVVQVYVRLFIHLLGSLPVLYMIE